MRKMVVSAILVGLLLALGGLGYSVMASRRKPPAEEKRPIPPLAVEAARLWPVDTLVKVAGWGTVTAPNRLSVRPEVGGEALEISPNLESGARVEKGELLVRIDPEIHALNVTRGKAELRRLASALSRLGLQESADRKRLVLLEKTLDLVRADHARALALLEEENVGTLSQVQALERSVLVTEQQIVQMKAALESYPVQREELDAQKASAEAQLKSAEWSLSRTEIRSPLSGRVESAFVERGAVVSPGREIAVIVDDRILELKVPMNARDVALWIPFEAPPEGLWSFGVPAAQTVEVRWVEAPDLYRFTGELVRIEKVDARTRQALAVIRLDEPSGDRRLVEGMFCKVSIPGKRLEGVFAVPRAAVAQDGTIHLARDGRLARFTAEVLRVEEDLVILGPGLPGGDLLILTRLINPVEGTPLEVTRVYLGGEE
jgi:RND family efflux transporter MFP subunit